jgi:hypothetical protein
LKKVILLGFSLFLSLAPNVSFCIDEVKILEAVNYLLSHCDNDLWSKQNGQGGIISLSDQDGEAIGSANCETTSLTLLIYNDDLINDLSDKTLFREEPKQPVISLLLQMLMLVVTALLLLSIFLKK